MLWKGRPDFESDANDAGLCSPPRFVGGGDRAVTAPVSGLEQSRPIWLKVQSHARSVLVTFEIIKSSCLRAAGSEFGVMGFRLSWPANPNSRIRDFQCAMKGHLACAKQGKRPL